MTSRTADGSATTAARRPAPVGTATRAVTSLLARQARRGAIVVAVICGGLTALVAVQYRGLADTLGTGSLTALAGNPAISTLFGPPVALDDPGGFTVWRTGTVLGLLVGIWSALTATRLTRGSEEAGRWNLLLAGRLRLGSLVGRALLVVLVAALLSGVLAAVGLVLAATDLAGAVLFGTWLAGTGTVGAAVGTLAAQLLPDRRAASGLAVAALLGALLARMISDGVPALGWLAWGSPFGLLGRVAPFADDRALPLVVLLVLSAAPAALAVRLATRRDVGGAVRAGQDHHSGSSRLLVSLTGLAIHRTRHPLLTWATGLMAYFLLIGLLASAMTTFLRDNPAFARLAAQAGFAQLGSVEGYVSALFALLAVPIGAFAAGRIAASVADETACRLTLLYALPVARSRWAAVETLVVAAGCLGLAAAAGLATFAGTSWVGAGLGLADAMTGVLSIVPVALLCLGAAVAALGWAPSAVLAIGLLPAAGGYLLLVLSDSFDWPDAVAWFSPFSHLNAVPAEPVDVPGTVGMLVVAVLLVGVGLAGYERRDLIG